MVKATGVFFKTMSIIEIYRHVLHNLLDGEIDSLLIWADALEEAGDNDTSEALRFMLHNPPVAVAALRRRIFNYEDGWSADYSKKGVIQYRWAGAELQRHDPSIIPDLRVFLRIGLRWYILNNERYNWPLVEHTHHQQPIDWRHIPESLWKYGVLSAILRELAPGF